MAYPDTEIRFLPRRHEGRAESHTKHGFGTRFTGSRQAIVGLKVRELIRQTCEAFEIEILKGVVSQDHVHVLLSAPPNLAPSEIVRRIKGRRSIKLFERFPDLKKRYWEHHFWARGYFCVTSGELTDEMIKNYLEYHF